MLGVVCFKWRTPGYRSQFGPETVNTLRHMVRRHYSKPHRFFCVTDDPTGLEPGIVTVPLWTDHAGLQNPHGNRHPSCYRRLKMFAPEAGLTFGDRFVMLDLDNVVTGDLTPIFERPEDFVMYGDTNPKTHYNGSLVLMSAGCRRQVWEQFDPQQSPVLSRRAGQYGSDQGWISYCLGPGEAKFTRRDGVYSYRNELRNTATLPEAVRLVVFHGEVNPWSPRGERIDWVKAHYRMDQPQQAVSA